MSIMVILQTKKERERIEKQILLLLKDAREVEAYRQRCRDYPPVGKKPGIDI